MIIKEKSMDIVNAIKKISHGENLNESESESVMKQIMTGVTGTAQIVSYLTALKDKGEAVQEIVGSVRAMRSFAEPLPLSGGEDCVDTCGTGGDGKGTFNISTAVAFVTAGAGVKIAKHGNRAVSGKCGSADVLKELGVHVDAGVDVVAKCISDIHIGFLFAPVFHKAMKHAVLARKEIGGRTLFNLLGPLTNPAGLSRQLIGVYDRSLVKTFPEVLKSMGSTCVMAVHGKDGLDEISLTDETYVGELKDGQIRSYVIKPEDFGLERCCAEDVLGGSIEDNADIIRKIFNGEKGPKRDIVVLNSAAALCVSGMTRDLAEGLLLAKASIDQGKAKDKLEMLIECSNS